MSVSFVHLSSNYKQVAHDLVDYKYQHDPCFIYPGDETFTNDYGVIKENSHSIDPLHAMMMCNVFEMVIRLDGDPQDEWFGLEIGSHAGFSTHYLAQLMLNLDIVEPNPQPTLKSLVDKADIHVAYCTTSEYQKKFDTLNVPYDFVFIDGNHDSLSTQIDVLYTISVTHPNSVIVLHDTNLCQAMPELPPHTSIGPQEQMRILIQNGWYVIEDKVKRPGMRTERGLAFATKQFKHVDAIKSGIELTIGRTNSNNYQ